MINHQDPGCDLLVVSPHPDDAEIGVGGMLAALAARGRRVWTLELTRGELGSNATVDERWAEAQAAADVLGLTGRVQLGLPDGFVSPHDRGQVGAVTDVLRRLRPRWVVTAPDPVRHPDHVATPELVRRAAFLARLAAWQPEADDLRSHPDPAPWPEPAERWQVEALWHVCPDDGRPDLLFDVTAVWPVKLEALACYRSQFVREPGRRTTAINDPDFQARIERRARHWGRRAGTEFAEALCSDAAPVVADLPDQEWR
jgi:bacillithiol biosynthesis deacetylase BshB1